MKRRCPYCSAKLDKKSYDGHIAKKHSKSEFRCIDGCVRCCTDKGMPLELTISDFERIRNHLGLSGEEMFNKYCEIMWNMIPYTYTFIPSVGLRFSCGFLKENRCTIYSLRPIHCRMFPENLVIDPGLDAIDVFKNSGYKCIDADFEVSPERRKEIKKMMRLNEELLRETVDFFENPNYCVDITAEEYNELADALANVDAMEFHAKKRNLLNELMEKTLEGNITTEFVKKIKLLR